MRISHQSGTQMHVQGSGVGTLSLMSMPSLDEGPLEAQTSIPCVELTMIVWDLDDDQLWEVLEALQTETA